MWRVFLRNMGRNYKSELWDQKARPSEMWYDRALTMTNPMTITCADTENFVPLTINQNDVTNNPDAQVINNTTNSGYSLVIQNTVEGNDNCIKLVMGTNKQYPHIKWEDTEGNPAIQITAHELADNDDVHDHFRIYRTNDAGTPRGILEIDFDRDAPDVAFGPLNSFVIRSTSGGWAERENVNVNTDALDIQYELTVDDGSTYTKQGSVLKLRNNQTETNGTITDSAICLDITQSGDTGDAAKIVSTSTGNLITCDANGNVGTTVATDGAFHLENSGNTGHGIVAYTTIGNTVAGPLVYFVGTNSAYNTYLCRMQSAGTLANLYLDMNGTGQALLADHDDTGTNPTIEIDRDGNNAADIYGMKITVDNAGAGNAGGIDFSGMAQDEPLIKAIADAITTAGTLSQQLAIDIGGTTYYLYAYTHGS